MNLHMNQRLNCWAVWCLSGRSVNIGFPSQCPYTRLQARTGTSMSAEFNEEAWEIEQAVQVLDEILKQAVYIFYLGQGTAEQKARDCSCTRATLYNRIDCAHIQIMDWLHDYYAEKKA